MSEAKSLKIGNKSPVRFLLQVHHIVCLFHLRKKACRFLKIHLPLKTAPLITQLQIVKAKYNSFWRLPFEFEKIVSNHLPTHLHQNIKLTLVEIDAVVLPQDALQVHKRHVEGVCNADDHLRLSVAFRGNRETFPRSLNKQSIADIHRRRPVMPFDRRVVLIVVWHSFHEGAQRRASLPLRVLIPPSPVDQTVFENLFFSVHSFSLLQAFRHAAQHHLFTNLPALRSSGLTRSIAFPQNRHIVTSIGLGPSGLLSSIAARMIHSSLLAARSASSMLHLINKNFYPWLGSVCLSGPAVDHLRVVLKNDPVHTVQNRLLDVVKVRL
nr:MAG TPA: hypothetical protein [Caudoviricetes sp.]